MSEYLPEEEHSEYKNWCSHCINEGDSECCWCRDDTDYGVPSMYDDGSILDIDDIVYKGILNKNFRSWCKGSTTGFDPVCRGSSPRDRVLQSVRRAHCINLARMGWYFNGG